MVKSEFIKEVAYKSCMADFKAEKFVDAFLAAIVDSLCAENRVEIRGFGVFVVRKYKSYEGRNPKTGEKIQVAEKKRPFWKAGLELRKAINK